MARRLRRARAVLALFVALLVCIEGTGLARAMSPGAMVHCCCGVHAIARACKCPMCPIRLRAEAKPHDDARVGNPSTCIPSSADGLLIVLATLGEPPRITHALRAQPFERPPVLPPPCPDDSPQRPPP